MAQSPFSRASRSRFHRHMGRSPAIPDEYESLEQVQRALYDAGLKSSNLIVGIDFTQSNTWTGRYSFQGRCLHALGDELNPYQKALNIIGRALSVYDEDKLIPCFGFGDRTTCDKDVFSFNFDHSPCRGLDEALSRYNTLVSHLQLFGPTSFAPIIDAAVDIVEETGGKHHILVIVADGQIESNFEQATVEAIVNASRYALSIVLVGVGDGPWEQMESFDDSLPTRHFDNFQFVNFTKIMQRESPPYITESEFAKHALMEVPQQFKLMSELGILNVRRGESPRATRLAPPMQAGPSTNHQYTVDQINAALGPNPIPLGKGGFGQVFLGELPEGTKIAVKKLSLPDTTTAKEKEISQAGFKAEVKTLERARHKNLIDLLGNCATDDSYMLVYEFMAQSSLEKWIYIVDGRHTLTWSQRLKVISGVGAALVYLHSQCIDGRPILHLDIKPANILLNDSFEPKLADFGLARIISKYNNTTTYASKLGGTIGYMAPELLSGEVSVKSDVYSFGIVLLEIVRGRGTRQLRRKRVGPNESQFFHAWASASGRRDAEILQELDPSISGFRKETAIKLTRIGLQCVCQDKDKRPSMQQIVRQLDSLPID